LFQLQARGVFEQPPGRSDVPLSLPHHLGNAFFLGFAATDAATAFFRCLCHARSLSGQFAVGT